MLPLSSAKQLEHYKQFEHYRQFEHYKQCKSVYRTVLPPSLFVFLMMVMFLKVPDGTSIDTSLVGTCKHLKKSWCLFSRFSEDAWMHCVEGGTDK